MRPRVGEDSSNDTSDIRRGNRSGWKSSFGTGKGGDTITSGLEVTWTTTPTKWSNNFFKNLFSYEWELTHSIHGNQEVLARWNAIPL